MADFLKKAFQDMKESAKAQHEVDKANFEAVKAESKANWEEAKAQSRSEVRKAAEQARRDEQIAEAKERTEAAKQRISDAKGDQKQNRYRCERSESGNCPPFRPSFFSKKSKKEESANKTLTFGCYNRENKGGT